jgi:hypothetical protein
MQDSRLFEHHRNICTLSKERIYIFVVTFLIRVNSHYFPKEHLLGFKTKMNRVSRGVGIQLLDNILVYKKLALQWNETSNDGDKAKTL